MGMHSAGGQDEKGGGLEAATQQHFDFSPAHHRNRLFSTSAPCVLKSKLYSIWLVKEMLVMKVSPGSTQH